MSPVSTQAAPAEMNRGRALAPDLARGLMLLLIALANTPWYLYGSAAGTISVHPLDGSALDRVVQAVIITAVDARVYPMFAFLFGYGIVQLHRRSWQAGVAETDARRVLRRRHLWMLVFGLVHAALLWHGDIIGAYGLAGLVLVALFLRRRDVTLLTWAGVLAAMLVSGALLLTVLAVVLPSVVPADLVVEGMGGESFFAPMVGIHGVESYPTSVLLRLFAWSLLVGGQGLLGLVVPACILLAFWAARREVLENPGAHRRLLVRVAVIGIGLSWVGGALHAAAHLGVLAVPELSAWAFTVMQPVTGMAGGLGYVAAFALLAERLRQRGAHRSLPVRAVTAVGKRSLSCYLAQSVLCAPVLAAWGLGLGGVVGSAATAGYAVAVWLVTVVGAMLLEQRGHRGPAEVLLRRLTYGRRDRSPRPEDVPAATP